MADRSGIVSSKGNPLTLTGSGEAKVGSPAPDATLSKSPVEDVKISDFKGKKVILSTVPSLDTGVCAAQTARFNQEAASLGDDVVILTVSRDLPMAQARWCQANSVEAIVVASDYKHRDLGDKYGLEIKELGLLARTVSVIDANGTLVYQQIVPEVPTEPDYEAVLQALAKLS